MQHSPIAEAVTASLLSGLLLPPSPAALTTEL